MISKIGFIGAGKVGTSLGRYFKENGIRLSGYYSKSNNHAARSADFTDSNHYENLSDLVRESDAIFVTVPDDNISIVWSDLKKMDLKDKYLVHCSGAMSSKVFDGASDAGAYAFSLHPMCSVADRTESWKDLDNTYFTVEGDLSKIEDIAAIPKQTGNNVSEIDPDSKIMYHAAAVFVSNLVIGTVAAGRDIFKKCGLSEDFAENAWKSLFIGNANNIVSSGLTEALTGPVERADVDTVIKHLHSLEGRNKNIYVELSRMILDVAKIKHPERDYTKIEKELNTK